MSYIIEEDLERCNSSGYLKKYESMEKIGANMKYAEAMAAIKKGDLKSVYLIAGEESYLAEKIEQALLDKLLLDANKEGLQKISGDIDLSELMNLIDSAPFFSDRNVILVRGTTLLKEKKSTVSAEGKKAKPDKKEEQLLSTLADMPPYSVLILVSSEKPDKRRKLYKTIEKYGMVVEAEPLHAWNINEWLQAKLNEMGKQLDREAHAYLLEAIGVMQKISLGFLDQELSKLTLYTDKRLIEKKDLLQILSGLPEVSIFAMLDAISEKNTAKALQLLNEQLETGTYPLNIAALLIRHVRQLWQAKTLEAKGYSGRQLAAPLGLVPFVAEKVGKYSRSFNESALQQALMDLAEMDYKLKSGQAEPALLERIIIELCRDR